ncbi:MAG TPA: hypothetical protein PLJ60_09165 [Chryseolinea sp.]|nr:hypothetical protein [Chryseolinea sp.]
METFQIKILNPKAKDMLIELVDQKLIAMDEEKNLFHLTSSQKKSIRISRTQIKEGKYKLHKTVVSDLKKADC